MNILESFPPSYIFIILCVLFILFYFFFLDVNIARNFLICIILTLVTYMYFQKKSKESKDTTIVTKFIDTLEEEMARNNIHFKHIYALHKAPKRIQYIRFHTPFKKLLYDLRYLKKYDKHNYIAIVILCEYFLKYHYNIIIGKYDISMYNQVVLDIRREMLNILYSCIYNIPTISTIIDKDDMDKYLFIMCMRLQSITQKYINIIHNSNKQFKVNEQPTAYDYSKEHNYDIM